MSDWSTAADVATAVGVVLAALTYVQDRWARGRRQAELISAWLALDDGADPADCRSRSLHLQNGSDGMIREVEVRAPLAGFQWSRFDVLPPGSRERFPADLEWISEYRPPYSIGELQLTFIDSGNRRWLRDSTGELRRLRKPLAPMQLC